MLTKLPWSAKGRFAAMLSKRKEGFESIPWQAQPDCPLLNLPGEVLNIIYRSLLVSSTSQDLSDVLRPPIIATCRRMRKEAVQIFLKENKFIWKLHLKVDCTLEKSARDSIAKWMQIAGAASSAYFGDLVFWLVAPPVHGAVDMMAVLRPTDDEVILGESKYYKFDYFWCTKAGKCFCDESQHICDAFCGRNLYAVREPFRASWDARFNSPEQLQLPNLGIFDVMAMGESITSFQLPAMKRYLLRTPCLRWIAVKYVYIRSSIEEQCAVGKLADVVGS